MGFSDGIVGAGQSVSRDVVAAGGWSVAVGEVLRGAAPFRSVGAFFDATRRTGPAYVGPGEAAAEAVRALGSAFKRGASTAGDAAKGAATSAGKAIGDAFGSLADALGVGVGTLKFVAAAVVVLAVTK